MYRFIELLDFTHPACGLVLLSLASSLSFKQHTSALFLPGCKCLLIHLLPSCPQEWGWRHPLLIQQNIPAGIFPGWNLRLGCRRDWNCACSQCCRHLAACSNLYLMHSGPHYSEEQELRSVFVLGAKRWSWLQREGRQGRGFHTWSQAWHL